jgi:transcriptional regulator NrdR family protein
MISDYVDDVAITHRLGPEEASIRRRRKAILRSCATRFAVTEVGRNNMKR